MSNSRSSKARLVITAITLGNRTVAEVVADHGVSKSWVHGLRARHRDEGDAALEPRSRRPHTSQNETWQSDFTHYRLTTPDGRPGQDVEISWLDDHSCYALHVSAHRPVTAKTVLETFRRAADLHGCLTSTLTDIRSGWASSEASRRPARRIGFVRHLPVNIA